MGTEHCMKWQSGRYAGRQTLVAYCFGRADSQKVLGPTLLGQVHSGIGCNKQTRTTPFPACFLLTGCMGCHVQLQSIRTLRNIPVVFV